MLSKFTSRFHDPDVQENLVRSGKEIIHTAKCDGTNAVLDQVVVNKEVNIKNIAHQAWPQIQGVSKGGSYGTGSYVVL